MLYASLHWNSFENDFSFRPLTQSTTQHTLARTHRHSEWSEVNLLDILFTLSGRRTSSSSEQSRSLLNSCSALLSASSARVLVSSAGVVICLSAVSLGDSDSESGSGSPQDQTAATLSKIFFKKHAGKFIQDNKTYLFKSTILVAHTKFLIRNVLQFNKFIDIWNILHVSI